MPAELPDIEKEGQLDLLGDSTPAEEPLKAEDFVATLTAETSETSEETPEKKAAADTVKPEMSPAEVAELRRRLEAQEYAVAQKVQREDQARAAQERAASEQHFLNQMDQEDWDFAKAIVTAKVPEDGPRAVMEDIVYAIKSSARKDAIKFAHEIAQFQVQAQNQQIMPLLQRLQAGYSAQGFMSRQDLADIHDMTNEAVYLQQAGIPEDHIVEIFRRARGTAGPPQQGHLRAVPSEAKRSTNIHLEESGAGRGEKALPDADIDKAFKNFWRKHHKG